MTNMRRSWGWSDKYHKSTITILPENSPPIITHQIGTNDTIC